MIPSLRKFYLLVILGVFLYPSLLKAQSSLPAYRDQSLSVEKRVNDLVSRMSLEEKISQMQYTAPAIPRLGIAEYNWWNECLHGVARNGIATVFPQAIGMAATWNPELIRQEADIISTEARAKYREAIEANQHGIYQGLTFWSPNINIFRDPRWGRGQETYGEDPYLTSAIGKAFVEGLQGTDPNIFKVVATAKHFAVHSGPESERHRFDAWPPVQDFYDTYLPAFEALVKEAKVYSVMSCYNRVYGTPSSASPFLFEKHLRDKWNFKGYVVSDCWAISDIYNFHNFVPTAEQAASLSVRAGTDLACGPEYASLVNAVAKGFITEYEIDVAVKRLMEARFRLGMFDAAGSVVYDTISPSHNNTPAHSAFALKVARESIVLLKNQDKVLPLSDKIRKIAVIGPYADDTAVLLGNYNGTPSAPVTLIKGIQSRAGKKVKVLYCQGVDRPEVIVRNQQSLQGYDAIALEMEKEALKIAVSADMIIFCAGISPNLEGEEMDVKVEGFSGGDRTTLDLPASQQKLLEKLKATGKPVILVLTNGSALAVNWAGDNVDAIIEAWYPGQQGGNAVADVIFGKYNPAGRLPVTFYKSVNDLPPFNEYAMDGRTYRYFQQKPLYPFGYGLSYSIFRYGILNPSRRSYNVNDTIVIRLTVENTSKLAGDEVVQLYAVSPETAKDKRIKFLVGFNRVNIPAVDEQKIEFRIPAQQLRKFDSTAGDYVVPKGKYMFLAGGSSADIQQTIEIEIR
jgi:beta-glucosidase